MQMSKSKKDLNKENTGQSNNRWNHDNTFDSVSTFLCMFKRKNELNLIAVKNLLLRESVHINTKRLFWDLEK
jgi:hypothetical protein